MGFWLRVGYAWFFGLPTLGLIFEIRDEWLTATILVSAIVGLILCTILEERGVKR